MALRTTIMTRIAPPGSTVLVTGITGYLGAHISQQLLQEGFQVRAVVRNLAKSQSKIAPQLLAQPGLALVEVADLVSPTVDELGSVLAQIHGAVLVACPAPHAHHSNEDEVLAPSVAMVTNFLSLARAHARHLARIVLTGSLAAIVDYDLGTQPVPAKRYTDADCTPVSWAQACETKDFFTLLSASKLFPEQAARKWADANDAPFLVVSLLPAVIFGPFLHLDSLDDVQSTPAMTLGLLHAGDAPSLAKIAAYPTPFPLVVDVRDAATAHVQALISPAVAERAEAEGTRLPRYVLAAENYDNQLLAATLHKHQLLAPALCAQSQAELEDVDIDFSPIAGRGYYTVDDAKTRRDLNLHLRPCEETIQDMFAQFRAVAAP